MDENATIDLDAAFLFVAMIENSENIIFNDANARDLYIDKSVQFYQNQWSKIEQNNKRKWNLSRFDVKPNAQDTFNTYHQDASYLQDWGTIRKHDFQGLGHCRVGLPLFDNNQRYATMTYSFAFDLMWFEEQNCFFKKAFNNSWILWDCDIWIRGERILWQKKVN